MGTTWKRGKKNQGFKIKERRQNALERLEKQLKSGKKPDKQLNNPHLSKDDLMIDLTDKDKGRIEKEIEVLKERI